MLNITLLCVLSPRLVPLLELPDITVSLPRGAILITSAVRDSRCNHYDIYHEIVIITSFPLPDTAIENKFYGDVKVEISWCRY